MFKYYVEKTRKDRTAIVYIADSKSEVTAKAKEIRAEITDDDTMVCVCGADFNENNRRADNRYKFYGIVR